MEKEIGNKVIYRKKFKSEDDFKKAVQKVYDYLKVKFPNFCVMKEFYNSEDIIIRVIDVQVQSLSKGELNRAKTRDRDRNR